MVVMQRFLVVHYGISHESLAFNFLVYTRAFKVTSNLRGAKLADIFFFLVKKMKVRQLRYHTPYS